MRKKQKGILTTLLFISLFIISVKFSLAEFVVTTNQTAPTQTTEFVLQNQNAIEPNNSFILTQNQQYKETTLFFLVTQNVSEPQNNFVVNQYSLTKDFNFFSINSEINICSCSGFIDKITIQNTGNLIDTYEISNNKEYSKFPLNRITLNPGQKVEVINYITPGCTDFSEDMTTLITSSSGKVKELVQTVNTGVCDNLNLSINNNTFQTFPCTPVKGQLLIKNPLNFAEEYQITSNIKKGEIFFSENQTTIQPRNSSVINFTYASACDLYGTIQGDINVKTKNTNIEETIHLSINISKRYRYDITTPIEFETCNNLQTWIPITIKNNENFEQTFELSIPFSLWFKLQNKTITLKPYEQKETYIIASPKWKNSGETFIQLSIKSKTTEDVLTKEIKVNIPDCYKHDIISESKISLCSDDKEFGIKLKNSGTKNNTFLIIAEGLQNTSLIMNAIVESNDTVELSIPLNLSDEDKDYKLKIITSDGYFNKTTKIKLDVSTLEQCYKPEINIDEDLNVNSSLNVFNITFKKDGQKSAEYYLWLDSPPWANLSKKSVTLFPNKINNVLLKINAGNESGKFYSAITLIESSTNIKYTKYFVINANEKQYTFRDFLNSVKSTIKNNLLLIKLTLLILLLLIIGLVIGRILYRKRQQKLNEVKKLIIRKPARKKRRK